MSDQFVYSLGILVAVLTIWLTLLHWPDLEQASHRLRAGMRWTLGPIRPLKIRFLFERRSPDGDGLPMRKGLGDQRVQPPARDVEPHQGVVPEQARVHPRGGLDRNGEASVKPAAGSEPADAYTTSTFERSAVGERRAVGTGPNRVSAIRSARPFTVPAKKGFSR